MREEGREARGSWQSIAVDKQKLPTSKQGQLCVCVCVCVRTCPTSKARAACKLAPHPLQAGTPSILLIFIQAGPAARPGRTCPPLPNKDKAVNGHPNLILAALGREIPPPFRKRTAQAGLSVSAACHQLRRPRYPAASTPPTSSILLPTSERIVVSPATEQN